MLLVRYCIVLPTLNLWKISPVFTITEFVLLIISVVLISASGYCINDYFDVKTDEINKPDKIVVGRIISRRKTMLLHTILSLLGLAIAIYLALSNQNIVLCLFHFVAWVLLWYYSVYFKRTLAFGNILVSFLTSSVIVLVYFSEYALLVNKAGWYNTAFVFCMFYATFAFLINLIREIIKDAEDVEGDKLINANTIPIKLGLNKTKIIVSVLAVFSCVLIFVCLIRFYWKAIVIENIYALTFTLVLSFALCFYFIFRLNKSDRKTHFALLSSYIKIVLTIGLASMLFLNI